MLSKGQRKNIKYYSTTKRDHGPKDFGTKIQSSDTQYFVQDVSVEK